MKVCFLAGTLGLGGAEKQLLYMIKALRRVGVDVRVMSLTRDEPYQKEIEALGVDVEWVGRSPLRPIRLLKILNSFRRRPADILQSAHFYTNLYVGLCSRFLGVPSIGAIRNDLDSEIAANGIWGRWQLRLPNLLVANSQLARRRAIEKGGISADQVRFVPNVIELADKNGHRRDDRSTMNTIFVGRLVRQKRPDRFILLARTLIERFPERHLIFKIAGDGPLRSDLEKLAGSNGLSSDVLTFLGAKSEMGDVYDSADILVLTSSHEGVPNVLLEAMSRGIPVVATRVGGVDEILNGSNGVLVEPDDLAALADATALLINSCDRRSEYGANGREFVKNHHSINGLGPELQAIYSSLTGSK